MKIGRSFVMIFSHPFQTVLFALDIIDFDLLRILLSSTANFISRIPIAISIVLIVVFPSREEMHARIFQNGRNPGIDESRVN